MLHLGATCLACIGVGGPDPQIGKGVELGENGPIRIRAIGFLLASHLDQSAISYRLGTTQQRYIQTDGQTYRITMAIVDLMLRADALV